MIVKVKKNKALCFFDNKKNCIWCNYFDKNGCFSAKYCYRFIFAKMSLFSAIKYKLFGVL